MSQPLPAIALFAKFPRAGKAKTRLIPALGADRAASVHRRLAERTLETVRQSGLPFAVWTTGGAHGEFRDWLGSDVSLIDQGEGDLGARLARVPAPAIVLGADIPDLSQRHLRDAAEMLETHPAVIGPAADGGYYLLGFRQPLPFLWADMRWGGDTVLGDTLDRLRENDVPFAMLDTLRDCDRPEDLAHWPDLTA